ncbi:MAG TPA: hypothetical protein VNE18_07820 [Rhodanobacter sp.]|nr:hypothetical protein [Rhodanobacter sp.]
MFITEFLITLRFVRKKKWALPGAGLLADEHPVAATARMARKTAALIP